jgi:multimeric flavodoxin WrbA
MKLVIFSCSPRPENTSNTAAIAGTFRNGILSEREGEIDVYYLYKRSEWDDYKKIFKDSDEIIFALPLFVECVPGLLLEFLETLAPKDNSGVKTKIGFILNSGFYEACQLRTCEKYLETLPAYFNCEYSGTLIKGGMAGLSFVSEKTKKKMLQPFFEMGKLYAKEKRFEKTIVSQFAAPERFSKSFCFLVKLSMPLETIFLSSMAHKLGANDKLNARPFETF